MSELLETADYKCQSCGKELDINSVQLNHIIPMAKGGDSSIENMEILCRSCNANKK